MLKKLKKHWKVETKELLLILGTFAVTGTVTAWLSKMVAEWLMLNQYGLLWWVSKIIVLLFGYQIIILIVGFCFGMFPFFWNYEKKILRRFGLMKREVKKNNKATRHRLTEKNIVIFASGAGTNALKIINFFKNQGVGKVALIICNNPKAGVIHIAQNESIPVLLIEKKKFLENGYVKELQAYKPGIIVLAGFLWKIPSVFIQAFPHKIINIHPALLPAHGGKGMYGNAVHAAVINAKEKESGITIHFVDEIYDHGKIIFQATCTIVENETTESLAKKIHLLEHEHYPKIISKVLNEIN